MIIPIFETIFIHRSKDVVDTIRHRSLWHLGEWILTNPERLYCYLYSSFIHYSINFFHNLLITTDGLMMII